MPTITIDNHHYHSTHDKNTLKGPVEVRGKERPQLRQSLSPTVCRNASTNTTASSRTTPNVSTLFGWVFLAICFLISCSMHLLLLGVRFRICLLSRWSLNWCHIVNICSNICIVFLLYVLCVLHVSNVSFISSIKLGIWLHENYKNALMTTTNHNVDSDKVAMTTTTTIMTTTLTSNASGMENTATSYWKGQPFCQLQAVCMRMRQLKWYETTMITTMSIVMMTTTAMQHSSKPTRYIKKL